MLEKICTRTENRLYVLKGQALVHEFLPPGCNDLTADQQRYRGAIAVSINDGHAFFYECPNAHRGISLKKLEKLPG